MKTVIWDYNGTILNDAEMSLKIENEMLEKRGLKAGYTLEDYKNLFDMPMLDYYKKIGYTFENESFDDVALEFYDFYDRYFDMCGLNEGVLEKLELSKSKGYRNIILSSCHQDKLKEQCEKLGISDYFEAIIGVDNYVSTSKTDNGKKWMEENSVNACDCVFIGDTSADYATACALGIHDIYLICQGHQSYERLKALHPNTFHSLKEIHI